MERVRVASIAEASEYMLDTEAKRPGLIPAQQAWWATRAIGSAGQYALSVAGSVELPIDQIPLWTEAVLQETSHWAKERLGLDVDVQGRFQTEVGGEYELRVVLTVPGEALGVDAALDLEEALREWIFAQHRQNIAVRVMRSQ